MHRYDIETSYFWFALGVFVTVKALKLGLGELSNPGPGFIFFLAGILLCILSTIVFTHTTFSRKKLPRASSPWVEVNWRTPVMILLALLLYASFFDWLGFLVTCFLFTLFLFKVIGRLRWPVSILNACLISAGTYLIFKVLLKCSLPNGIFPI